VWETYKLEENFFFYFFGLAFDVIAQKGTVA
jgi:hypothetical protein